MTTQTAGNDGVQTARNCAAGALPVANANTLPDALLLQICRVQENDPQITREWIIQLRIVPHLVGSPRPANAAQLEAAVTFLASILGALRQFNPKHLPFGYSGPQAWSRGWVELEALERVGKQIVGLRWPQASAETVAAAVQHAVSESIRLGFMEQREYDAWRPGMASGSGWRAAVATTPYGVLRACRATEFGGDEAGTEAEAPQTQTPPAETAAGAAVTANRPPEAVALELGCPGAPSRVRGQLKKPLTDAQRAVVAALIKAGQDGLSKDALEAIRPSARRILKALQSDPDWAAVLIMPGQTNGRYRIRA